MTDMTNNRVPYGLLTDEEKAALHEHEKAGGTFEIHAGTSWWSVGNTPWHHKLVLRTVPRPAQRSEQSSLKTQDVIAWDRLPAYMEWVARDDDGEVFAYETEPYIAESMWDVEWVGWRIDYWPGLVQIGTADWRESKQRRPQK
jgi:hypothetical protein